VNLFGLSTFCRVLRIKISFFAIIFCVGIFIQIGSSQESSLENTTLVKFDRHKATELINTQEVDWPTRRENRPEIEEMLYSSPNKLYLYDQYLYSKYLHLHHEKYLLQSFNQNGHLTKFFYNEDGLLSMIERYYPQEQEWHECEIFIHQNGILKEQYFLEKSEDTTGRIRFWKSHYTFSYSENIVTISSFSADGMLWATETRFYSPQKVLQKISYVLAEKWRLKLTFLFTYAQGMLKEQRLERSSEEVNQSDGWRFYYDAHDRLQFIARFQQDQEQIYFERKYIVPNQVEFWAFACLCPEYGFRRKYTIIYRDDQLPDLLISKDGKALGKFSYIDNWAYTPE